MFVFVDVDTQSFPDYIQSVPTLVIEQNMIKADDVFGYLNNMVEQIFQQHPELKAKYHPQQQQQQQQGQQQQGQQQQQQVQGQKQQQGQQQQQQQQGQQGQQQQQQVQGQKQQLGQQGQKQQQSNTMPEKPGKGPDYDPVDELVGWCPDGGCSFADISEQNDDCSKKNVSLQDNMFSPILEENDQLAPQPQKVPMEQDNAQFQKSAKQQQMDSSYERLMSERQLIK